MPATNSSSIRTAKFGATPIRLMGTAVRVGATMTNQRTLIRSAQTPMNGLTRAGSCMTVVSRPALVSDMDSFLISSGSSGDKKLV